MMRSVTALVSRKTTGRPRNSVSEKVPPSVRSTVKSGAWSPGCTVAWRVLTADGRAASMCSNRNTFVVDINEKVLK